MACYYKSPVPIPRSLCWDKQWKTNVHSPNKEEPSIGSRTLQPLFYWLKMLCSPLFLMPPLRPPFQTHFLLSRSFLFHQQFYRVLLRWWNGGLLHYLLHADQSWRYRFVWPALFVWINQGKPMCILPTKKSRVLGTEFFYLYFID